MANKALPSSEVLRQLLRYDAESGKLFWRERPVHSGAVKSWNSKYAGKVALNYQMANGYLQGAIYNVLTTAHRAAWAMQTGMWPSADIDHIDGDRSNNRLENLREASRSDNNKNRRPILGRSSQYLGVSLIKSSGLWDARITANGKQVCLGHFREETDAARAYDAAARTYHGAFSRPNFSD